MSRTAPRLTPPVRPLPLVIECPFHEVCDDADWARTQLDIVRHCEDFEQWKKYGLCGPRDSVHCRLCHKSLRRSTEQEDNMTLLRKRQFLNTTR